MSTAQVLTSISDIVSASISWMGSYITFVGNNPIILVYFVLPLAGFAVSILKRLLTF